MKIGHGGMLKPEKDDSRIKGKNGKMAMVMEMVMDMVEMKQ